MGEGVSLVFLLYLPRYPTIQISHVWFLMLTTLFALGGMARPKPKILAPRPWFFPWQAITVFPVARSITLTLPTYRLLGGKIHHSDLLFMSMAHNSSSILVQVDIQKSQCIPPISITTLPSISISCNKSFYDEKATMSGSDAQCRACDPQQRLDQR
jgi:hypothetical protein